MRCRVQTAKQLQQSSKSFRASHAIALVDHFFQQSTELKTECTSMKAQASMYCLFWAGECLVVFQLERVEHQLGYNRCSCYPPAKIGERFSKQVYHTIIRMEYWIIGLME